MKAAGTRTNIRVGELVAGAGIAVELGEEAGHAVRAEGVEPVGGAEDHERHVAAAEDGELHGLLEDARAALGKCILCRFSGGFFLLLCFFGMSDVGCTREETNLARALVGNAADRDLVAAHWRRRVGGAGVGTGTDGKTSTGKTRTRTKKKKAIPLKKTRRKKKKLGRK